MRALGGTPGQQAEAIEVLAASLAPGSVLVLDNAEHLVDAVAALVRRLLSALPALHVLVTSQVPLAIAGERIERLGPLPVPDAEVPDVQALDVGAVAMFVHRVRTADSRHPLGPESIPLVRRLCAELDGLPLALEMAAARVPVLGLQQVLDSLSERFAMLRSTQRGTVARHRTLNAALDWSFRLLPAEEQRLFRALGVFAGGFTVDLVVAVAGDGADSRWDVVDRLAALVDRSLVTVSHDDPPRYGLLETMRHYALIQLAAAGDEAALRQRHAAAIEDLFRAVHDLMRGPGDDAARARAQAEMENAREALGWAAREDHALAVRLSAYVANIAALTAWRADAFAWLSACEPWVDGITDLRWQALWWRHYAAQSLFLMQARTADRARRAVAVSRSAGADADLLYALVYLVRSLGPTPEAEAALQEARSVLDRHPEWPPDPTVLLHLAQAHASVARGEPQAALAPLQAALACARQGKLRVGMTFASLNMAEVLHRCGRGAEALALLEEIEAGADPGIAVHVGVAALRILFDLGRFEAAFSRAPTVLAQARQQGLPSALGVVTLGVAQAGRLQPAALLVGLARRVCERRGIGDESPFGRDLRQAETLVRQGLPPAMMDSLLEQSARLDEAEAERLLVHAAGQAPS